MHLSRLIRTMPSAVVEVAATGQTCTQGELSHWLQSLGTKKLFVISLSRIASGRGSSAKPLMPPSGESTCTSLSPAKLYRSTQVRLHCGSHGTLFSCLQARAPRPQPLHFIVSITSAQLHELPPGDRHQVCSFGLWHLRQLSPGRSA